MSEPIKKISDRGSWGDSEFRQPAGTYHVCPGELEPGDLIAFECRVWSVVDVEVLTCHHETEHDRMAETVRSCWSTAGVAIYGPPRTIHSHRGTIQ